MPGAVGAAESVWINSLPSRPGFAVADCSGPAFDNKRISESIASRETDILAQGCRMGWIDDELEFVPPDSRRHSGRKRLSAGFRADWNGARERWATGPSAAIRVVQTSRKFNLKIKRRESLQAFRAVCSPRGGFGLVRDGR